MIVLEPYWHIGMIVFPSALGGKPVDARVARLLRESEDAQDGMGYSGWIAPLEEWR